MAVFKVNSKIALQNYEGFIRIFVAMPNKVSFDFDYLKLVIVHLGDYFW